MINTRDSLTFYLLKQSFVSRFDESGLIKNIVEQMGEFGVGIIYFPCECLFQVPIISFYQVLPTFSLPSVHYKSADVHRRTGQYKAELNTCCFELNLDCAYSTVHSWGHLVWILLLLIFSFINSSSWCYFHSWSLN